MQTFLSVLKKTQENTQSPIFFLVSLCGLQTNDHFEKVISGRRWYLHQLGGWERVQESDKCSCCAVCEKWGEFYD